MKKLLWPLNDLSGRKLGKRTTSLSHKLGRYFETMWGSANEVHLALRFYFGASAKALIPPGFMKDLT